MALSLYGNYSGNNCEMQPAGGEDTNALCLRAYNYTHNSINVCVCCALLLPHTVMCHGLSLLIGFVAKFVFISCVHVVCRLNEGINIWLKVGGRVRQILFICTKWISKTIRCCYCLLAPCQSQYTNVLN